MLNAIDRLLSLRVSHAMSTHVDTISAHATMEQAASLMAKRNIRGLPVVNEFGKCVGMLTTTDFAFRSQPSGPPSSDDAEGDYAEEENEFSLVKCCPQGAIRIEYNANDQVKQHMTTAVQTIDEKASLTQAARYMCAEHVHRLVVLDESSLPVGILSTLDLVAAWVGVVDE